MAHIYNISSRQKNYHFREYTDRVVMLRTAKSKKQIRRTIKNSAYIKMHESEEDLWFKRFGICIKTSTGLDYSYRKKAA